MTNAVDRAKAKLERIITREGDAGGFRRTNLYLYELVREELLIEEMSKQFDGRKKESHC